MDPTKIKCPYCGSEGPFLESDKGFSLWPELGKNTRLCMNCRGPFGVNKTEEACLNQSS